jgi:hypothetical protein
LLLQLALQARNIDIKTAKDGRIIVNAIASISFGALLYLAALAGSALSHNGYETFFAIGPIALFHFSAGLSTIGGASLSSADRAIKLRCFVLAGVITLLCSACAIALAMMLPVWMPPKPAVAVICATWVAGASLLAYLHARATGQLSR